MVDSRQMEARELAMKALLQINQNKLEEALDLLSKSLQIFNELDKIYEQDPTKRISILQDRDKVLDVMLWLIEKLDKGMVYLERMMDKTTGLAILHGLLGDLPPGKVMPDQITFQRPLVLSSGRVIWFDLEEHKKDREVIHELEKGIGKPIPQVPKLDPFQNGIGFTANGNVVTGLILWYCELTEIPSLIFKLSALQELNLGYDKISQVPKELLELKDLTYLKLPGNQFTEIPAIICQMKSLQALSMGGNQLREIPSEIGNLIHLRELDLRFNKISHIPETIAQLAHLELLNLANNPIKELPESLKKFLSRLRSFAYGNRVSLIFTP